MAVYQRVIQDSTINIRSVLIGSENTDFKMQKLFEHCSTILSGESLVSMNVIFNSNDKISLQCYSISYCMKTSLKYCFKNFTVFIKLSFQMLITVLQ